MAVSTQTAKIGEKTWSLSLKKAKHWLNLPTKKAQKEALTQMQEI